MKAALLTAYGPADRLVVGVAPTPGPHAGELLIRVAAAGIDALDTTIRRGALRFRHPARFPLILGHEVAGWVAEVGPEVSRFEPGDRVVALLAEPHGGGWAEFAIAREDAASSLGALTFEQGAALPVSGLTALQALRDDADLDAGETVLITDGADGIGHYAIQLAAAAGARVTAVDGAGRATWLRGLGARRVIDASQEDFTDADEIWDVVFDVTGTLRYADCEKVLDDDGVYLTTAGGPTIAVAALRSTIDRWLGRSRPRVRTVRARPSPADLDELVALAEVARLRPTIARVFPLEDVAEAAALGERGQMAGKVVLRIASD